MIARNHHEQLVALFKEHFQDRDFLGIEIGTAQGLLTKSLLLHIPNLTKLYTIDPYVHKDRNEFEASLPQIIHEQRKQEADIALDIYSDRLVRLIMGSDEAVSQTPDDVDFVYIDGDHTSSQIKKDLINYYPKVKMGGIFGGHDYHRVMPVFRDMIAGIIYLGDDWSWWVIKDERKLYV
jgi:hypothetical protein